MESMRMATGERVLISGAGFAGLTAAFWMRKLGYEVTIVETGIGLKKGGTPVDIRDDTVDIVTRMGILDAVRAKSLPPRRTDFVDAGGAVVAQLEPDVPGADGSVEEYEIHRDDLLGILFGQIVDDVEMLFANSIASMTDTPAGVHVAFRDGSEGDFALVLGCDGNHSTVRRLRFGPESEYTHFLHNYFSVAIVDETFLEAGVTRVVNAPGRTLMLNSYETTTDIVLAFHSDDEIAYDYHDATEQKKIVRERFADAEPQFREQIERAVSADDFYFDRLSQTTMPSWASGRVVLVGDAGYCASPAAGMGGSLAIMGATALYDAFRTCDGGIDEAQAAYESTFRPVAERIQAEAVAFGLPTFFPETEEAIRERNSLFAGR